MAKTTYTAIQDWMLDLGLDVWEVIAYAVIFGFSQDGESTFRGSLAYLSRKMVCSRDKTIKSLRHLVELGLVEKIEIVRNGVKFCEYKVLTRTGSTPGIPGNEGGGSMPGRPNNKEENIKENISPRFIPPTLEMISAYAEIRRNAGNPPIDPQAFYNYNEASGWKVGNKPMKDWKAAFRTWEDKRRQDQQKTAPKQHTSVNWNDIKF